MVSFSYLFPLAQGCFFTRRKQHIKCSTNKRDRSVLGKFICQGGGGGGGDEDIEGGLGKFLDTAKGGL